MRRICIGISIAALAGFPAFAETVAHPASYDEFITKQSAAHGVPERLVHRIVMRESRYNPGLIHNHCFGMMQIKYETAKSMGYKGAPKGLLNPEVNMTYAIPYLSNAYRVAEGDEDRAVAFFAGGYYYAAKHKQMLAALRTADSPPLTPEPPPAPPPPSPAPFAGLFAFLQGSPPAPVQQANAAEPAAQTAAASAPSAPAAPATAAAPQPTGSDAAAQSSVAQNEATPTPQDPVKTAAAIPVSHTHAEKSLASAAPVKNAHNVHAKPQVAVASVEPSKQSTEEPKAAHKAAPKMKSADARAKTETVKAETAKTETAKRSQGAAMAKVDAEPEQQSDETTERTR